MQLDYFKALNINNIKNNQIFIISGNEPFQKQKVTNNILEYFKNLEFELSSYNLTEQNSEILYQETSSISLFNDKKIFLLNIDNTPKKIQQTLIDNIKNKSEDNIFVIIFNNLKKTQTNTKWFKQISANAIHINIYNPNIYTAFKIIKKEINDNLKVKLTDQAINILIQKTEGNLIATNQILTLLNKQQQKYFDKINIKPFLHEHSQYDIFDLSETLLSLNKNKSLKIFSSIISDPTKITLVLWAIKKEIRIIYQLHQAKNNNKQQIFRENNIWASKERLYNSLINKISITKIFFLLDECLNAELILKGAISGDIQQKINYIIFEFTKI